MKMWCHVSPLVLSFSGAEGESKGGKKEKEEKRDGVGV